MKRVWLALCLALGSMMAGWSAEVPAPLSTERVTTEIFYPVGMIVSYFIQSGQLPPGRYDMVRANAEPDSPFQYTFEVESDEECTVKMECPGKLSLMLYFTLKEEELLITYRLLPAKGEKVELLKTSLEELRGNSTLSLDLNKLEPVYAIVRLYNPKDTVKKGVVTVPLM